VLFSLVSLGVPDALLSGPLTAAELAATAVGPTANAAWLDRLLSAAADMGMLQRSTITTASAQARAAAKAAGSRVAKNETASDQQTFCPLAESQGTSAGPGLVYEYSLNAFSAALTPGSPVNMSALVAHCADQYHTAAKLSEVGAWVQPAHCCHDMSVLASDS
jgi:hypothetical protein